MKKGLYKLTTQEGKSKHGDMQWGEGVTNKEKGKGVLCGPGWIHAYSHPLLATFFNPIDVGIRNPLLWEAEGIVGISDGRNIKMGCTELTTIRKIELPHISPLHAMVFAIITTREIYKEEKWTEWANQWLLNEDRGYYGAHATLCHLQNIIPYYNGKKHVLHLASSIALAAMALSQNIIPLAMNYILEALSFASALFPINLIPLIEEAVSYKEEKI